MGYPAIKPAPTRLQDIEDQDLRLTLSSFTSDDAFGLGTWLREWLRNKSSKPALISVSLASQSPHPVFLATTHPGTTADNHVWVARKTKTVMRFGQSSWYMSRKFADQGGEAGFAAKFGLDPEKAGQYAIHGGAVPIRVEGVEGLVGILVVSGLKQDEDHMAAVQAIKHYQWFQDTGENRIEEDVLDES